MAYFSNTVANSAATVLCVTTSCLCYNSISIAVYSTGWHKEKIATRKVVERSWLFDAIFIFTSVTNATSNIILIIAIYCGKEACIAKKAKFWNIKNVLRPFIIWNALTALTNYAASLAEAAVLDIRLRESDNLSFVKEITAPGNSEASTNHQSSAFDSGTNDTDITVTGASEQTQHDQGTRLLGYLVVFYTLILLIKMGVLYFVYYKFLRLLLEDTLVAAGCSYSEAGSSGSQELQEGQWSVNLIRHSRRACETQKRESEAEESAPSRPQMRSVEQHPGEEPSHALEEWVEASTSRRGSITDQALPMNVVPNRSMPRTAIWAEAGMSPGEDKSSSLEALQQKSFLRRPHRSSATHNHHILDQHGTQLHKMEDNQHRTKTAATKQHQASTSQNQHETSHV